VIVPAMPNAHSHAFQRALRGAGERATSSFWGWRDVMYELVGSLDDEAARAISAAAFAEMRAAGYGAVGEFHYLPDLTGAVVAAADDAGVQLVLIPAAYHRGGHERFRHASLDAFLAHAEPHPAVAAHSVRACPPDWLREIARYSDARGCPRHVHASEQPREVEECRAEHGLSPIELLHETGFLGPRTSVIHGIHVSDRDIALLADSATIVVTCPTTEGNLGDGHFPAMRLLEAGVRIAIGSDSNVRIDPFEECRELETNSRRQTLTRNGPLAHFGGDLWGELARNGAASLGVELSAEIEVDVADGWELATAADQASSRAGNGRPTK
jgi:formimidoylglutamate deiminase